MVKGGETILKMVNAHFPDEIYTLLSDIEYWVSTGCFYGCRIYLYAAGVTVGTAKKVLHRDIGTNDVLIENSISWVLVIPKSGQSLYIHNIYKKSHHNCIL